MDAPEPLEHGGGSPGPAADDLKEDGPKENTEGAPTAEGREKVEGGADSDEGGPGGPGAAGAGASSFCGAGDEVGVVGVLPVVNKMEKTGEVSAVTTDVHVTENN